MCHGYTGEESIIMVLNETRNSNLKERRKDNKEMVSNFTVTFISNVVGRACQYTFVVFVVVHETFPQNSTRTLLFYSKRETGLL